MIKIGLIGCGMIAEWGHLPAIQQTPGFVLEALYDPRWARTLEMQKRYHAKHAYPKEKDFWNSDFDAVIICTPAPLHLEHATKAAKYDKHILCEKPLAMTESEIMQMIQITNKAKVKLYTGFTYRFSPSALEIHRLIRNGEIGEVRALRLIYLWNLHGKWQYDSTGVRIPSPLRVGRMEEGGPMVDCGVHQIDLARWWLGSEVDSFRGIGVWVEDFEAPDHMYLHMGHKCGAHTTIEMSFSYNATSKEPRSNFLYELIGTDGVIRFHREEHNFELRNSYGTRYLPWYPEKNFQGMYSELLHALTHNDDRNMPLAKDGLAVTQIAREATEQAIAERDPGSKKNHSSMSKATSSKTEIMIPADSSEPLPVNSDTVTNKNGKLPIK